VLGDQDRVDTAIALAHGRPRRAYEALAMGDNAPLTALQGWLRSPGSGAAAVHLQIADALAADKAGSAYAFGREMLSDWIAAEVRQSTESQARARLASAEALWEKATALFADAEEYNLDARQTLLSLMDAIRRHAQTHILLPAQ
jgi:DNA polymerase III subunit delta'